MEKTWRCTVCGYLHKGDSPPEICPVCGVDSSKFELVEESASPAESEPKTKIDELKAQALTFFEEMKASFVPHAVSAHFPNALLPTCFLFLIVAIVSGNGSFEAATFYVLFVAFLATPVTFATGLVDWKTKFSGELTPIFKKKIILGVALFLLGMITAGWRWYDPEVLSSGGFSACAYSLLILAMLGCVALLGHYGGLLVFAKHNK